MAMTKLQIKVLQTMAKLHLEENWEESEIAAEGSSIFLGYDRILIATLKAFLDHCAVSDSSDSGNGKLRRYKINTIGLLIARKPEMADPVWLKLRQGEPFTVQGDEIIDI